MLNKLITLVFAASFMVGCSNGRVSTDYEVVYDFSTLKTFFVLPADKKIYDNPKISRLDVKRIGELVPLELSKKYRAVEKEQADFLVRYFLVVEEKMRVDTYNTSFGFYRFGFGYRYGFDSPNVQNSYYQRGSIIVDILDAKSDEVIWRGVTEGRVVKSDTPNERRIRLQRKLERLFSLFPPPPEAQ